jgi:acetylornithine deacetylase/succinyl-diaminopimelate desuccinylase-like protein
LERIIPLLKELIRNKCINHGRSDSGDEIKSAFTLKSFFDSYKIKSEIFESRPGRASILARIKGTSVSAPSLMYMGHLDVVPASEDGWASDPFSGDERGGYIWGRGTIDMLNMVASAAVAFAEHATSAKKPEGDLLFLAVADEEASGRLGARWLVENHWEKVKADYMISEGGGYFLTGKPSRAIALTRGEKGIGWTKLTASGSAGHGSLPYLSENAALKIAQASMILATHRKNIILTREYRDIVRKLPLGAYDRFLLSMPFSIDFALGKISRKYPGLAKHLHALSRMTVSPNVIKAGQKINTIPDQGSVECDIRLLPGESIEDVYRLINRELGKLRDKFEVEIIDYFPSNTSPIDTPLYDAVSEIATSVYPDARIVPNMFSGVTDARFWRMRGTVVYGFALFDETMTLDEYTKVLHGKDERISLKSIELTYNFFRKLPDVLYAKAAGKDRHKEISHRH